MLIKRSHILNKTSYLYYETFKISFMDYGCNKVNNNKVKKKFIALIFSLITENDTN